MIDGLGTGLELPLALFLIGCVAAMVCALPWRRWVLCAAVLGWGGVGRASLNDIWVANNSDGTVTKLTASTGALVGTYTVGTTPEGVAFDGFTLYPPPPPLPAAVSSGSSLTLLLDAMLGPLDAFGDFGRWVE